VKADFVMALEGFGCKNSPEFDDEFQGNLIIGVCITPEFQGFAIYRDVGIHQNSKDYGHVTKGDSSFDGSHLQTGVTGFTDRTSLNKNRNKNTLSHPYY
jgi:hypothetical protein